jgi:IrrE N-terminal-like domain
MSGEFEEYTTGLCEYATNLAANSSCPIALRPICRQMGVHGIRRERLSEAKSILVDASSKPVIILRTEHGRVGNTVPFTPRERFLIAHELGHLVLRKLGAKNPSGQSQYWKVERLCDAFSRRLLMPDRTLSSLVKEEHPNPVDRLHQTQELLRRCRVPWSIAAMRVADVSTDTTFLRVIQMTAPHCDGQGTSHNFKVVTTTRENQQGIGQLIKHGTALHQALRDCLRGDSDEPHDIDREKLLGIAGLNRIASAALCLVSSSSGQNAPRALGLAVRTATAVRSAHA